jgi:hypothetical protein
VTDFALLCVHTGTAIPRAVTASLYSVYGAPVLDGRRLAAIKSETRVSDIARAVFLAKVRFSSTPGTICGVRSSSSRV